MPKLNCADIALAVAILASAIIGVQHPEQAGTIVQADVQVVAAYIDSQKPRRPE